MVRTLKENNLNGIQTEAKKVITMLVALFKLKTKSQSLFDSQCSNLFLYAFSERRAFVQALALAL